jgi:hypothetical protein
MGIRKTPDLEYTGFCSIPYSIAVGGVHRAGAGAWSGLGYGLKDPRSDSFQNRGKISICRSYLFSFIAFES